MMTVQEKIHLVDIEKELKRLWLQEEGKSKVRACLFNLVIYVDQGRRAVEFEQLVQNVVRKYPCRVIFIKGDSSCDKEFLNLEVLATSPDLDSPVLCDQINIEVSGPAIERVPFITLAELLPDLPVYLLWAHDPAQDMHILPKLEKYASHVIFDSEGVECLPEFAAEILQRKRNLKATISDMNWVRIKAWRQVLAKTFNTPKALKLLAEATHIRLRYNEPECNYSKNTLIQAFYLKSWLAAQLHWTFVSQEYYEGKHRFIFDGALGQVIILFEKGNVANVPAGHLLQIDVEAGEDNLFSIQRIGSTRQVRIHVSAKDQCKIPYRRFLSAQKRGQNLMQEMFFEEPSEHYTNMLRLISSIGK